MSGPAEAAFIGLLKRGFIGTIFKASLDASGYIQISLAAKNRSKAETFIRSLTTRVDTDLRATVAERAKLLVLSLEPLLSKTENANVGLSDSVKQAIISGTAYSQGGLSLFTQAGDLQVIAEKQGRAIGVVISVLAGLFLGVLAAFVVEAIANIRKDVEVMGRIREALGKGGENAQS